MMSESAANFQFKGPIGLLVSFSFATAIPRVSRARGFAELSPT